MSTKVIDSSVIREKERYVKNLEKLLVSDRRSSVKSLNYAIRTNNIGHDEIAHVEYRGGHIAQILVTGNSLGAIAKEIIREVYE